MTIRTVLVANRSEIARRIFRTAAQMGLRTVAVFSPVDERAPFVTEADEAVRLHGGYLDFDAVVAAARATGADAIHPGYGFGSENAEFARAVIEAGITWIGPSPDVIAAMGDKLAAKQLAAKVDVPALPSSDDPADHAAIGFPLLVKAAAGGGGKGMRVVERVEDLEDALAGARREAQSGFGDDRVFLERYVARSRHIEIQVLGDTHGNLVHLGERECSVQRRHQKIIEECPSPAVHDHMRAEMGDAALRLAAEMGYTSAGTVEFLVDDDTREFFFLEMNTRLQVEHPVTEAVTGIDLVREQIRIAADEALDIVQSDIDFSGHAIEARLYAEDPTAGFLPATGTLVAFRRAASPELRWDSGVEQGSVVGVDYDPMLAKVIALAPTRAEATTALATGLERLHLGGVTTNRDFLVATLRHADFVSGNTTTELAGHVDPEPQDGARDPIETRRAGIAAAMWIQHDNRAAAKVLADLPSGWRNARLPAQQVVLRRGDEDMQLTYQRARDGSFAFAGGEVVRIHGVDDHQMDLEVDGVRRATTITRSGDRLFVQTAHGTVELTVVPRFTLPGAEQHTGGLVAPMPGVVLEVRVAPGDRVVAGQTVALLEAMKMEHQIRAPSAGVVSEVLVAEGQQVDNGAVLMVIDTDEDEDSGADEEADEDQDRGAGRSTRPSDSTAATDPADKDST